jgi:acyl carrier protein
MLPAAFVTLAALPLTATGKVDRLALPEPERTRSHLAMPLYAPRTPIERELVGLWTEVLGVEPIGIHDAFLDLGGDSLLASRLMTRVMDKFHLDMPFQLLMQATTVEDMAMVITQRLAETAALEDVARLLAEVERLSDDAAQRPCTGNESS